MTASQSFMRTNDFRRFERLGLNSNPFRTLSRTEWGEIAFLTPEIQRLVEQENTHLQLLGNLGRGKTTTLLGIGALLEEQSQSVIYEYLAIGQRRFKTNLATQHPDVFLLDEAQRLWHYEKWRLLQSVQKYTQMRLIFSSHVDLSGWFKQRNLPLVPYHVDHLPTVSLGELLNKRLEYFLTAKSSPLNFTDDAMAYLEKTFGSNRRQMEQFLYEVFELMIEPKPITSAFLIECMQKVRISESQGILSIVIKRQTFRTWRPR